MKASKLVRGFSSPHIECCGFPMENIKYTQAHTKWRKDEGREHVARHDTKQNDCSSTDSSEQPICLRYRIPSFHRCSRSISQSAQKYLLKRGNTDFLPCAHWKRRDWWKKLALARTWMDSAQLIKIKRFNSGDRGSDSGCTACGGPFWLAASWSIPWHSDARQSFAFSITHPNSPLTTKTRLICMIEIELWCAKNTALFLSCYCPARSLRFSWLNSISRDVATSKHED